MEKETEIQKDRGKARDRKEEREKNERERDRHEERKEGDKGKKRERERRENTSVVHLALPHPDRDTSANTKVAQNEKVADSLLSFLFSHMPTDIKQI